MAVALFIMPISIDLLHVKCPSYKKWNKKKSTIFFSCDKSGSSIYLFI